ncbi:unnamed protein product [Clavelina lepadiformis]|uniref:C2H2-type domain-containing protein n=1 Tax=Clavelina lepadiformis TaxID=159417 RepID=A0ABP0G344_CLALP
MQENMEDVVSTLLAEIKKTETMNNAMPVEETSQTTVVKSDINLNIEEVYSEKAPVVYSEKAPVFPLVEATKEEPLLLGEYEVSQTEIDEPNISMLNKFHPQSDIGVNATVQIVKPQSCVARNSYEKCCDSVEMFLNKSTAIERINACKVNAQLLVGNNKEKHFSCNFCDKSFKYKRNLKDHLRTHTDMKMEFAKVQENMNDMVSKILAETKKVEIMNNAMQFEETSQPSVAESESDFGICIDRVYSEKASVLTLADIIKEEPFLLEEYEVSQTETDDPSISMLNKFPP